MRRAVRWVQDEQPYRIVAARCACTRASVGITTKEGETQTNLRGHHRR